MGLQDNAGGGAEADLHNGGRGPRLSLSPEGPEPQVDADAAQSERSGHVREPQAINYNRPSTPMAGDARRRAVEAAEARRREAERERERERGGEGAGGREGPAASGGSSSENVVSRRV